MTRRHLAASVALFIVSWALALGASVKLDHDAAGGRCYVTRCTP